MEKLVGHVSWSSSNESGYIAWEIPDIKSRLNSKLIRSPCFVYYNTPHFLTLFIKEIDTTSLINIDIYTVYLTVNRMNALSKTQKLQSTMLRAIFRENPKNFYLFQRESSDDLRLDLALGFFTNVSIHVYFTENQSMSDPKYVSSLEQRLFLGGLPNFKPAYLKKLYPDFQINVGKRIFYVHKMVMAYRSPVFADMLENGEDGNGTKNVIVTACDADAFHVFLLFLYCGETEEITRENVLDVYTIADRYEVHELKTECVNFMKDNMSNDKFCSIILLASKYNEKELLEECEKYFTCNAKAILECDTWKFFLYRNTNLANELLLSFVN